MIYLEDLPFVRRALCRRAVLHRKMAVSSTRQLDINPPLDEAGTITVYLQQTCALLKARYG
ncbi:MAG: hypothetical protein ACSLFE_03060 [Gemmatimonadaceae bacterium]